MRRLRELATNWSDPALALAKRRSPLRSVSLDPDAVVTGDWIKSEVDIGVGRIMERLGVAVIDKSDLPFGTRLLVSDQDVPVLLNNLVSFAEEDIVTSVQYIVEGKYQILTNTSSGMTELAKVRIAPESIYGMKFHKNYSADNAIRSHGSTFKSEIRFVASVGEWWTNSLSDIWNSDVQKSHLKASSLPATTNVTFPVDIVYTWVNGSDPKWLARKDATLQALGRKVPEQAADRSRWEDRDELRYSLRSVALFASWVRNIYLVTDDQIPDWLRQDGKVTVIDHRDLFPKATALPTFNSHAIESVLHRIDGLSEHFLYMNDDVFFGSAVAPEVFFSPGGLSHIFLSSSSMPIGDPAHRGRASEWGGMNASGLIEREFGRVIRQKARHTPMALRVSVLREIEEKFPETFRRVNSSQFRDICDIAPLSYLYPHYSLVTGRAVVSSIRYGYFNINNPSSFQKLRAAMRGPGTQVYCLNDTESDEPQSLAWYAQDEQVRDFLTGMYPWKSPWEI